MTIAIVTPSDRPGLVDVEIPGVVTHTDLTAEHLLYMAHRHGWALRRPDGQPVLTAAGGAPPVVVVADTQRAPARALRRQLERAATQIACALPRALGLPHPGDRTDEQTFVWLRRHGRSRGGS